MRSDNAIDRAAPETAWPVPAMRKVSVADKRATADRRLFYDTIAASFDDVADRYDLDRRLQLVFDDMLATTDLRGLRLLDAGCGTGWFSRRAFERGACVTALDIGPALLAEVRKKCPVETREGDITSMPFANGAFDVVISSECIEHTLDPRQAVRELVRVCRPGGHVVLTCPNWTWKWSVLLANRFKLRPYAGFENWPGWLELRRWIRTAGATVTRSQGLHLFPFQVRPLRPLLRLCDGLGGFLGPLFVNQALLARKCG